MTVYTLRKVLICSMQYYQAQSGLDAVNAALVDNFFGDYSREKSRSFLRTFHTMIIISQSAVVLQRYIIRNQ